MSSDDSNEMAQRADRALKRTEARLDAARSELLTVQKQSKTLKQYLILTLCLCLALALVTLIVYSAVWSLKVKDQQRTTQIVEAAKEQRQAVSGSSDRANEQFVAATEQMQIRDKTRQEQFQVLEAKIDPVVDEIERSKAKVDAIHTKFISAHSVMVHSSPAPIGGRKDGFEDPVAGDGIQGDDTVPANWPRVKLTELPGFRKLLKDPDFQRRCANPEFLRRLMDKESFRERLINPAFIKQLDDVAFRNEQIQIIKELLHEK